MGLRHRLALTVFVSIAAILVATAAQAQTSGYAESYNSVTAERMRPEFRVFITGPLEAHGPLEGKMSWQGWLLVSRDWSEGVMSVAMAPAAWVSVSVGVGVETDEHPLRCAASLWIGKGKWSLLALHEFDGSSPWHRYVGLYKAKKYLAVGFNSQRFLGTGPYAEVRLGKVSMWGTYAVTAPVHKGAVGMRYNF